MGPLFVTIGICVIVGIALGLGLLYIINIIDRR